MIYFQVFYNLLGIMNGEFVVDFNCYDDVQGEM